MRRSLEQAHPRYGRVHVRAWGGLHPELERRAAWGDHTGPLPIIEGSNINLTVDHLPGDRAPKPMWLWCSDPDAADADLDWWWRSYLRRFDIEHTFRFLKQTLARGFHRGGGRRVCQSAERCS